MKNIYYIIILVILVLSCQDKSKKNKHNVVIDNLGLKEKEYQKYTEENGFIKISELSISEFLSALKVSNEQKNKLNVITTIGQTRADWLTEKDLEYLISQIESKEKAKCINRMISSFIPNSKNMTIGSQVISIIEAYRKKEPYPNELYICEIYNKEKVTEILEWWKLKNGN